MVTDCLVKQILELAEYLLLQALVGAEVVRLLELVNLKHHWTLSSVANSL